MPKVLAKRMNKEFTRILNTSDVKKRPE